jgi:uncharacterized protein DUF2567
MSSPPAPVSPGAGTDAASYAPAVPLAPARRPWSAWSEIGRDLRPCAAVLAVLALVGFPVGLLWLWLAPRADFRITSSGPTAIGNPSQELLVSDDVVFALLLAGTGVLAGLAVWFLLRRRRGVATMAAAAVGTAATAAIAWQFGELLGPAPSKAEIARVGATVTTGLHLSSLAALAVGPFFAVLAYLFATLFTRRDDLGR